MLDLPVQLAQLFENATSPRRINKTRTHYRPDDYNKHLWHERGPARARNRWGQVVTSGGAPFTDLKGPHYAKVPTLCVFWLPRASSRQQMFLVKSGWNCPQGAPHKKGRFQIFRCRFSIGNNVVKNFNLFSGPKNCTPSSENILRSSISLFMQSHKKSIHYDGPNGNNGNLVESHYQASEPDQEPEAKFDDALKKKEKNKRKHVWNENII